VLHHEPRLASGRTIEGCRLGFVQVSLVNIVMAIMGAVRHCVNCQRNHGQVEMGIGGRMSARMYKTFEILPNGLPDS
jgi:hypothetical protein